MSETLYILDVIKAVDLTNPESIVEGATNIYREQCIFTGVDSRLVDILEAEYQSLEALTPHNSFDHYNIGIENLKDKFMKDVGQLLFYCSRIGINVR